ncbi:hypothetical protein CRUP_019092 [Coryphaenoides rupestris]|nr:hypothetical protein CRUP_019092 [Coryphaenoides rupestris]
MDKVINCFSKKPDAAARLVCFPWAGGGSTHYARWGRVFSGSVEGTGEGGGGAFLVVSGGVCWWWCWWCLLVLVVVLVVSAVGAGGGVWEPFFLSMQQIVDEVIEALLPALKEKPFAFFGHSFGAMTSFAVADTLKRLHGLEPLHLFLSGASAPYSETRISAPKRSALSDDEFLQWLSSIGGTPPELLANPEVMKLYLPSLKADLHVVENYRCNRPTTPLLSCPLTCFDGRQDRPRGDVSFLNCGFGAWKEVSSGDFTVRMLDGDHFYLKDPTNEKVLIDFVTKHLETSQMDYL